jgi:hypothetical protein
MDHLPPMDERAARRDAQGCDQFIEAGGNAQSRERIRIRLSPAARSYGAGLLLTLCALRFLADRWPPTTHSDFAYFFYPAGKQVLHGYLHYALPKVYTYANAGIFRYPPIAAALIAVFAWLPLHTAAVAWWAVDVILLALSAWWMASLFSTQRARRVTIGAVLLLFLVTFTPVGYAVPGQIDVWIVAIVAAAFVLSARGSGRSLFAAGALLGLAGSIKLYPLLTLAIIAWLRRDEARPLLAGAAACIVVCVGFALVLLGPEPMSQYMRVISTQGSTVLAAFPYAFGFLNIASRALVASPYATAPAHLSPTLVRGVFALFVAAVLVYVAIRFKPVRRARGAVWSVALVATALCSPFLEEQHLAPLALIPVMLAADVAAMLSFRWSLPKPLADLWPIGVACVACGALSLKVSKGTLIPLSLLISAGVGIYLLTRRPGRALSTAIFGAALVFIGAPAFLNLSAYWGFPMSRLHILLGSAVYVCLLLILLVGPRCFAPPVASNGDRDSAPASL